MGYVGAAYDVSLLRALQVELETVAFGYTAVVNTLKEAFPGPLIVLCHCLLASFTEAS